MENNESLNFSYSEIFFSYYYHNEKVCNPMVKNHTLVYVYSGELLLEEGRDTIRIGKGECVFLRRDNRVIMTKQPKGRDYFSGIFMVFNRNVLREFYQRLDRKKIPKETNKFRNSVIKLPQVPDISSLFLSMVPYSDSEMKPTDELMNLKQQEGIYSLLNADSSFYSTLFDFTEPWKIDILEFMEKNYMYDLSIQDISHYTGRSLATFKRDFNKICQQTPQKWLMEKRLQMAKDILSHQNKKVSEVYLEVGFKNLSHFSKAFKQFYGYSPSK